MLGECRTNGETSEARESGEREQCEGQVGQRVMQRLDEREGEKAKRKSTRNTGAVGLRA